MEIHYSQGAFNSTELVKYINLTGEGYAIYSQFIKMRESAKKAKALNLTISENDLQSYVDSFRISQGLHDAKDTYQFLSHRGLTIEDLEQFCHSTLLVEALKDHLADDTNIETYYFNNRSEFHLARISTITVKDKNMANEIKMQVIEDNEDFHRLARIYSSDKTTKYAGGYAGLVSRNDFPPKISAKIFNAQINDLIGPYSEDKGYRLIFVEELIKPELDDHVKELIREKIFEEWASRFVEAGIQCKVETT